MNELVEAGAAAQAQAASTVMMGLPVTSVATGLPILTAPEMAEAAAEEAEAANAPEEAEELAKAAERKEQVRAEAAELDAALAASQAEAGAASAEANTDSAKAAAETLPEADALREAEHSAVAEVAAANAMTAAEAAVADADAKTQAAKAPGLTENETAMAQAEAAVARALADRALAAARIAEQRAAEDKESVNLARLVDMGFEVNAASAALASTGGNVTSATTLLMSAASSDQPATSDQSDPLSRQVAIRVHRLVEMGFEMGAALDALESTEGNVASAAAILMSGQHANSDLSMLRIRAGVDGSDRASSLYSQVAADGNADTRLMRLYPISISPRGTSGGYQQQFRTSRGNVTVTVPLDITARIEAFDLLVVLPFKVPAVEVQNAVLSCTGGWLPGGEAGQVLLSAPPEAEPGQTIKAFIPLTGEQVLARGLSSNGPSYITCEVTIPADLTVPDRLFRVTPPQLQPLVQAANQPNQHALSPSEAQDSFAPAAAQQTSTLVPDQAHATRSSRSSRSPMTRMARSLSSAVQRTTSAFAGTGLSQPGASAADVPASTHNAAAANTVASTVAQSYFPPLKLEKREDGLPMITATKSANDEALTHGWKGPKVGDRILAINGTPAPLNDLPRASRMLKQAFGAHAFGGLDLTLELLASEHALGLRKAGPTSTIADVLGSSQGQSKLVAITHAMPSPLTELIRPSACPSAVESTPAEPGNEQGLQSTRIPGPEV